MRANDREARTCRLGWPRHSKWRGVLFISLWSLSALLDCGNSEDEPASDAGSVDAAGGTGSQCPRKAATCPSGCYDVTGSPIDEVHDCLLPGAIVACLPGGLGGSIGISGCIEEPSSGTKYVIPSLTYVEYLTESGEWLGCGTTGPTQACP